MNSLKYSFFALASVFTLISCTPSHQTTAGLCESSQLNSVSSNHTSFKLLVDSETGLVSKAERNSDNAVENEYRLYLQDILNALARTSEADIAEPAEGVRLTQDQADTAIESMINLFNNAGLNYTVDEDGVVTSADNPIDFLEYLIASTDDEEKIEAFVDAKRQMAAGIKADDDFCAYTNPNIKLSLVEPVEENGKTTLNVIREVFAELRMTYDPFNITFDQNILLADNNTDLGNSVTRNQTPFVGFYRADPDDFKAEGITPPTDRFTSLNNSDLTQILNIDDDFDDKLGQLEFITFDDYCYEKETINGALVLDDNGNEIIKLDDDNNQITTACDESIFKKLCYLEESTDSGEVDDNDAPIFETTQTLLDDCDDNRFEQADTNKICKIELFDGLGNPVEVNVTRLDDDGNVVLNEEGQPIIDQETQQLTINCQKNQTKRTSAHDECSAEGGTRISRSFDLLLENNTVLSEIQRLRLETDYETGEVRFYASSYNEAVLRAPEALIDENGAPVLNENGKPVYETFDMDNLDSSDYIENPTNCEKQAILDELVIIEGIDADDTGVRLTTVPDLGYDISDESDENGDPIEPIAIFTYIGTEIPDRK